MKKGFMLIELLIVIVIFGISMAIAIPKIQEKILEAKCRRRNAVACRDLDKFRERMANIGTPVSQSKIRYRLNDGREVTCEQSSRVDGHGMTLSGCADGNEYLEQVNITKLGGLQ